VTDWQAVRARYSGALRKTYLDNAVKGIPPPEAVAAIEDYVRFVRECPGESTTDDTIVLFAHLAAARRAVAELIGADEEEIALVESTQHGLNLAAEALALERGDRVLAADIEFFGTILPWWHQRGVDVELVPARDGRVEVDDLIARIDRRTRAVVVSSVQETNGYAVDLAALSDACVERGVPLVVDAIQHVGPRRVDVRATPVDFLAAGGHKWLCSPFGMGFLYVSRERLATIEPRSRGYMSMREPAAGWDAFLADPARTPTSNFDFGDSAAKLELGGTGSYLAAAALAASVRVQLELGPLEVEDRIRRLTTLLDERLREAGARVATPHEPECRAGIVTFRTSPDVADERRLLAKLTRAGVAVSLRFTSGVGGIRVAPHFYNDESDIERLLELVARLIRLS
jgi:cysteine desulfurase / selenocysteine lyase